MLLGLAQQGNAPKALARINKRGIPTNAVLVSAFVTVLCVLLNYIFLKSIWFTHDACRSSDCN